MTPIAYFKLQAKNLFKDFKTRTSSIDVVDGRSHYAYDAKYFDVDAIFVDFNWDEDSRPICLSNSRRGSNWSSISRRRWPLA